MIPADASKPASGIQVVMDRGQVVDVKVADVSLMHLVAQVHISASPRGTATNVQLKQEMAASPSPPELLP